MTWDSLIHIIQTLFIISFIAGVLALVFLAWTYRDIRRLKVPANAGFFGTMRVIPLRVAIFLDLMDMALDTFAAPIGWAVLHWLRLDYLKAPAVLEALIPGTQFIPTMTLAWIATRALNLGELPASVDTLFAQPTASSPSTSRAGMVIDGRVIQR